MAGLRSQDAAAVRADRSPLSYLAWLTNTSLGLKVLAGSLLLLIWQLGVMALAPPFVAKPLNVIAVFPSVIIEQEFIDATVNTLTAVLQGLLIALVSGTVIGVAMGRVTVFDRLLNFYVNGFYTMPMIAVLPLPKRIKLCPFSSVSTTK